MRAIIVLGLVALTSVAHGQAKKNVNYDESRIGNFPIPDPLKCEDGTMATTAEQWTQKRRPEVMRMFEREVYGKTPAGKAPAFRLVVTA